MALKLSKIVNYGLAQIQWLHRFTFYWANESDYKLYLHNPNNWLSDVVKSNLCEMKIWCYMCSWICLQHWWHQRKSSSLLSDRRQAKAHRYQGRITSSSFLLPLAWQPHFEWRHRTPAPLMMMCVCTSVPPHLSAPGHTISCQIYEEFLTELKLICRPPVQYRINQIYPNSDEIQISLRFHLCLCC